MSDADVPRCESRGPRFSPVPMSPRDVVRDALAPLALAAGEKGLELVTDIAAEVPDQVLGDPAALRQVLEILIDNAIKFTPRGSVGIYARELGRHGGCAFLHFLVTDTGIGIAPEVAATIFEPNLRADARDARRFDRIGRGLFLSATLVRAMGGHLWLESEPGAGSMFQFIAGFPSVAAPSIRPTVVLPAGLLPPGTVPEPPALMEEQEGCEGTSWIRMWQPSAGCGVRLVAVAFSGGDLSDVPLAMATSKQARIIDAVVEEERPTATEEASFRRDLHAWMRESGVAAGE